MEEKHILTRKNIARATAIAGAAASVCALLLSVMSGALAFRLYRYLGRAHRAMPALEEAARLYIEEHRKEKPGEDR